MALMGCWKLCGYKIKMRADRANCEDSFNVFHISVKTHDGKKVGSVEIIEHEDKIYATPHGTFVHPEHRRKGLALAMYAFYEAERRVTLRPDREQSEAATLLWKSKKAA